jgi:hypothetical protein
LLFVVHHALALALLLLTAAAAGTAVAGSRMPLALRSALGLAVLGQVLVLLATFGALRPWTIVSVIAFALAAGAARMQRGPVRGPVRWPLLASSAAGTVPLFALALYPPLAFDETLYHLPFVQAMASSGAIRFLPDVRFPMFPQLHEALSVPLFLAAGDTATHLVALAELLLLGGVVFEWPGDRRAGLLAFALLLGNPITLHQATITYVDMAVALFVVAGFRSLREQPAVAGFLLGTACSVKYLGWYFALAGLAFTILFSEHPRRAIPGFALALAAAVLPTYALIVATTANPVFPFFASLFGSSPWDFAVEKNAEPLVRAVRLFWDVTFARERVNQQPPYSPLFAVAVLVTILAARRDRWAAFLALAGAGYVAIFVTMLSLDSRYLLPLLPLVSVVAASAVARWKPIAIAVTLLSLAAGLAYVGYRFVRLGPLPLNDAQRRRFLEARIPEYSALERRGPGRIYVCGAEQLKSFGGRDLLGDVTGPYANRRVFAGDLSANLARLEVRSLLVSRRACPAEWQRVPAESAFELVYADAGAVLWRARLRSATDAR